MVVPEPEETPQTSDKRLLIKEITDRRPSGRWGVRKETDCRDSLHFQEGKAYMLNFLRIRVLRYSTA
jgi:hypothetical protein